MQVLNCVCFSLLFALGFYFNAFAQQHALVGLNINGEVYLSNFKPSIGLTFEKQFTRHSGVETGLFYRTLKSSGIIVYSDSSNFYTYSFIVSQKRLNLPVLYKYYSNIINFSIGPTLDFYLGWKQKDNGSPVHVENFDVAPKVEVGFLGKVSKVFSLNKRLVLEPELRFGFVQTLDEAGLGIGVAGKYRF